MAEVVYQPTRSLFKLLVKNGVLSIITLGFYRFWAKTHVRRFFWSSLRVGGEPLEYTGRGVELFVGFLIVIAILAPAAIAWHFVQTALKSDPIGLIVAQVLYAVAIGTLISAATFRARRYRLSRTLWRGIRTAQDGSTWRYIWLSWLWGMAALFTLGVGTPWMRCALQRYQMEHSLLGDQRVRFDAPPRPLLFPWLVVLAFAYVGYGAFIGSMFGIGALAGDNPAEANKATLAWMGTNVGAVAVLVLLMVVGVIGAFFAYARYRVFEFQHFTAHTTIGGVSALSRMRTGPVYSRLVLFLLIYLVGFPLIAFALFMLLSMLLSTVTDTGSRIAYSFIPLLIILTLFLSRRLVWTLVFTVPVLRHVCETLEVTGLESLDATVQNAAAIPQRGEGLADSFEIAPG